MPPYRLSLRTSTYCLSAQQVGRRKVGTYTFTITKSEARKNLPGFQILMFCNWVFLVFFLAKWLWVLGTRQRDVREIASFSQADLSTFRFDIVYLLIKFTFSWNSREAQMSSNSVSMHLLCSTKWNASLILLRDYLNNRVFLSRNYRLIVAPRKFDVLKTNICPRSEASRANMLVLKTSNFQGATIRSIGRSRMNTIRSHDQYKPMRISGIFCGGL